MSQRGTGSASITFIVRLEAKSIIDASTMNYRPLPIGYIRLVQLHSGQDENDIEVSFIQHVSLTNLPAYNALSYTWGNPNDTLPIKVDGSAILISKNLAICLWYLHQNVRRDETLLLWIDGLCINQQDNDEKNQQIRLMRRIYQGPACTVVWLGPENSDTKDAISLMTKWRDHHIAGTSSDFLLWLRKSENMKLVKKSFLACRSFGSKAWFLRVWVIQEVMVSTKNVARCGQLTLDLSFIAESISHIFSLPPI